MGKCRRVVSLALSLLVAAAVAAGQVPLGSEFRIDTRGQSGVTTRGAASSTPNSGFVVVWPAAAANPFNGDVMFRRFSAGGRPVGTEFVVNSYTTGTQNDATVATDGTGGFVVAWTSVGQDGSLKGVFGRKVDSSGTPVGGEFQVNESTYGYQFLQDVAVRPTGEFIVVWSDIFDIFARRYDASGLPSTGEFRVNTTTPNSSQPSVAFDAAGNFVVVWVSGNPNFQIRAQLFNAAGTPQGAEFWVSVGSYSNVGPRVARRDDGSFVIAWSSWTVNDQGQDILAKRYDASGTPIGNSFLVNQFTTGRQWFPDLEIEPDGDFVVAWESEGQDGSSSGVFARRFDWTGAGGPEFKVNTSTTGPQRMPSIAIDAAGNFVVAWHSAQNGVNGVFAQRYAIGLAGIGLSVDASSGPSSDGNGVLEAGETVVVVPSWLNAHAGAQTFTGAASAFTGPGTSGNPTYLIADSTAVYGTVASGGTGSCAAASDCYAMGIGVPSTRPAMHWDASFQEDIAPASLGARRDWTLHVGESFADVPRANPFYRFVETLLHNGVTVGCRGGETSKYCPDGILTRAQAAPLVLVAKEGPGYLPPGCTGPRMFGDVPASNPFCPWVEELARRGAIEGCGPQGYCPNRGISREELAVVLVKTLDPPFVPPACVPPNIYPDVPETSPYCSWIEDLARRGMVADCGGGNYCPARLVTRGEMAEFVTRTFGLSLYGP